VYCDQCVERDDTFLATDNLAYIVSINVGIVDEATAVCVTSGMLTFKAQMFAVCRQWCSCCRSHVCFWWHRVYIYIYEEQYWRSPSVCSLSVSCIY